jgi:hypothetical protein
MSVAGLYWGAVDGRMARSPAHSTLATAEREDARCLTELRRQGLEVLRLAPPSPPESRTRAALQGPSVRRPAGHCFFKLAL